MNTDKPKKRKPRRPVAPPLTTRDKLFAILVKLDGAIKKHNECLNDICKDIVALREQLK